MDMICFGQEIIHYNKWTYSAVTYSNTNDLLIEFVWLDDVVVIGPANGLFDGLEHLLCHAEV